MTTGDHWFAEENIDLQLEASSQLETITAMLQMARRSGVVSDIRQLAQELLHHEVMAPSASGCCAVIFRVLSTVVSEARLFLGRFDGGIGYSSKQGIPIDLIVLVIAPVETSGQFNDVVQRIELALCDPSVNQRLRVASDSVEVRDIFAQLKLR